jgi:hypothetical protein
MRLARVEAVGGASGSASKTRPPGKCSRGPGGGGLGPRSCGAMALWGSGRKQGCHVATGRVRRSRGRRPETPRGGRQLGECGPGRRLYLSRHGRGGREGRQRRSGLPGPRGRPRQSRTLRGRGQDLVHPHLDRSSPGGTPPSGMRIGRCPLPCPSGRSRSSPSSALGPRP